MDEDTGFFEMQHVERGSQDFRHVGLAKLTPINPQGLTPEFFEWLWEKVSSQDYVFDDFWRGDRNAFAAQLLVPGSFHFVIDDRGYAVVRNLFKSDNAELHYVIWDKAMQFREIKQCGYEIVNWCFKYAKVARITAFVPTYNKNALQFATILGFKFEGCLRNGIVYHDKHYDVSIFGLLQSEWLTSRYNHAKRHIQ